MASLYVSRIGGRRRFGPLSFLLSRTVRDASLSSIDLKSFSSFYLPMSKDGNRFRLWPLRSMYTHTHTHTHTHTPHFFALSQLHKGLQGFCLCVKDTPTRILFFLLKRPIETSQTAFLGLCHLFPRFLVSMPADAHGIYHGHENAAIHFLNDGHNPCLDH